MAVTLTKRSSQTASADAAEVSRNLSFDPERQTYELDAGAVNMIDRIG
jgi:hypothetical protein